MVTALLLAAYAASTQAGPAAETPMLSETSCGYLFPDHPGAPLVDSPNLHVLEQTTAAGRFSPDIPANAAIACDRSSIVPAANDWKVPAGGHDLYLISGDEPDERVGVLDLASGSYRYILIRGAWTPDEERRIDARVRSFQQHAR